MPYDLDTFLAQSRAGGLALSPDGSRAVTSVATVAPDGKRMRAALFEIDPAGEEPPRQLTRSAPGEGGPLFTPDGSVLFVSARPDPDAEPDAGDPTAALWCLPAGGGEAFIVAAPPGGVAGVAVARRTGRLAVAVKMAPGSESLDDDRDREQARSKAGVTAQLFDRYPIRHWDHYLGPRDIRYFVTDPTPDGTYGPLREVATSDGVIDEDAFDLSPDGLTLYLHVRRRATLTDLEGDVVAVDVKTRRRHVLTDGPYDHGVGGISVSPDGALVACVREETGTDGSPPDTTLWVIDLATGAGRDVTPRLDRFPREPTWSLDGSRLFFVADDGGHAPLWSVTVGKRPTVSRHTNGGAYSAPQPHPDGRSVIAMCSHVDHPAFPVRVELGADAPHPLPSPASTVKLPGRLVDVVATAADGTPVRSWLVLPKGASRRKPAPLVVWVHGGPVASSNDWSWRWNPWLLAERGYAVLLPDPALSTGYGLDFIRRGYGRWGDAPYTDVLAATDAACARPEIDAQRTALMGGSFGGYMANWVAGHTDRFQCIVTHASLWALDQFHGTTDGGIWWEPEFGDPYADPARYVEWSPHRHIGSVTTPMLVIHGELDHRVPIGEALRLWTDLRRHGVESKFLYFPDENHWVLKPQNARIWYETVFAWLDHHVLGQPWEQPPLL